MSSNSNSTTNEIRSSFLNYFEKDGHSIVSSSPLVPQNDPTLMFTNSGMVQFKNVFTGQDKRNYSRATTSQKCVRAGGKHNDLENVGYTARHHTFFEMLGNFSFGDYFKEHAIELAWTLITKEFGLDAKKLLVTIYHDDDEAADYWKRIAGLGDDRIIRIATDDNFWRMGDLGPCGPCSEIFYDHGPDIWGGPPGSPEEDGDRFIEIWNLVFMQFEQQTLENRTNLPKPSIDTGMGLERVAAVLQAKHDNYDIDLMRALIEASAEATSTEPDGEGNTSHRVIADHLRSSAFLIADGVTPSNEGRGYVLRRIMRRAMRHLHMLGASDPKMFTLVPALVQQMGEHFTELKSAQALITQTLELEETNFKKTLDRGLKLLTQETAKLGEKAPLNGEVAFKLYDTYGFPLDLTQDILRTEEREVDVAGFETAMAEQRARSTWSGSGSAATDRSWFAIRDKVGATDFLGYQTLTADAVVSALLADGEEVDELASGQTGELIFNQSSFYAESGGQEGDHGDIFDTQGKQLATVKQTSKQLGDLWVHEVEALASIARGDEVRLAVDPTRRQQIKANHSATHLLHEALRRELGDHVAQKGSLVADNRLRFDFSHNAPVDQDALNRIETEVNRKIAENTPVTIQIMDIDAAKAAGAMALFGEKYDDTVRVVTMGGTANADNGDDKTAYSMELCGGTHVEQTGDIGSLRISAEQGLASGVRRLEAVTGLKAVEAAQSDRKLLSDAALSIKAPVSDLPSRLTAMVAERKSLSDKITALQQQLATGGKAAQEIETIGDIRFSGQVLDDIPAKALKGMVEESLNAGDKDVVMLVSCADGKVSVVIGVAKEKTSQADAVALVKQAAEAVGGKGGGGRPDMAQAGGNQPENATAAIDKVRSALQ